MLNFVVQFYPSIILIIFFLGFILFEKTFSKNVNKYFSYSIICALLLVTFNILEAYMATKNYFSSWRVLFTTLDYIFSSLDLLLMLFSFQKTIKSKILLSLPQIINSVLILFSIKYHFIFYINNNNQLVHGNLNFIPILVRCLYILILSFYIINDLKKITSKEGFFIGSIAINAIIITIINFTTDYAYILCTGVIINIVFYYLFLYEKHNSTDILTGALVRRKFYSDASNYPSTISAIIFIDVNDLKVINDTRGHESGDIALKTICDSIYSELNSKETLYRLGGDEFCILCRRTSKEEIDLLIENIHKNITSKGYSAAIGYEIYDKSLSLDENVKRSDARMYEIKKESKEKKYQK